MTLGAASSALLRAGCQDVRPAPPTATQGAAALASAAQRAQDAEGNLDDDEAADGAPDGEGDEAVASDGAEPAADEGEPDFAAGFEDLVDGANIADAASSSDEDEEERDAAAALESPSGYPRQILLDGETCAGKSIALAALAHSLRAMGAVVRPGRPGRVAAPSALFAGPWRMRGGVLGRERAAALAEPVVALLYHLAFCKIKAQRPHAPHMPRVQPLGAAALPPAAAAWRPLTAAAAGAAAAAGGVRAARGAADRRRLLLQVQGAPGPVGHCRERAAAAAQPARRAPRRAQGAPGGAGRRARRWRWRRARGRRG